MCFFLDVYVVVVCACIGEKACMYVCMYTRCMAQSERSRRLCMFSLCMYLYMYVCCCMCMCMRKIMYVCMYVCIHFVVCVCVLEML
jgi:hypothetical protein